MIRWYDYIVAILIADLITTCMFTSISINTEFYMAGILGLVAGLLWNFWTLIYCKIRFFQELRRGK